MKPRDWSEVISDLAEMRREANRLREERDKLKSKLEVAIADKGASDQGWADQSHRDALQLIAVAAERDRLREALVAEQRVRTASSEFSSIRYTKTHLNALREKADKLREAALKP